jgi:uncharacterized protein
MISPDLLEILRCPNCVRAKPGLLKLEKETWLVCQEADCGRKYPIRDDIPVMLIDEGTKPPDGGRCMRLYLVRHGLANWPSWGGTDAERPLNPVGLRLLQTAGPQLAALRVRPDLILHSPYRRAQQTAEILAETLGVPDRRQAYDALRPGFNAKELKKLLVAQAQCAELMLVGHAPDVAEIVRCLTGGVSQFKEGTVALVKVDDLDKDPEGTLLWLIPPDVWTAT